VIDLTGCDRNKYASVRCPAVCGVADWRTELPLVAENWPGVETKGKLPGSNNRIDIESSIRPALKIADIGYGNQAIHCRRSHKTQY